MTTERALTAGAAGNLRRRVAPRRPCRPRRPRRQLLQKAAGLALGVLLLACGSRPERRGPIVLITFEGLRADAVSGLGGPAGLTPHLEALAGTASWWGSAIASSSSPAPAVASLLTGLSPREHRVTQTQPRLGPELRTLAETLGTAGYTTTAFREVALGKGWARGFDAYRELGKLNRATEHLTRLGGRGRPAREFTWLHFESPGGGALIKQQRFLKRLPLVPPGLPDRLGTPAMRRLTEGITHPTAPERTAIWALYCINVAAADEALGTLLAALKASGRWEDTLLIVAGTHGVALGEEGPAGAEALLGRHQLEVPLLVKLPRGARPLAAAPDERVAIARIFATLAQGAGAAVAPAVAPSLWDATPPGALSELPAPRGKQHISWQSGDLQYLRPIAIPPEATTGDAAAPAAQRTTRLLRWTATGVEPAQDPAAERRLAAALEEQVSFFRDAAATDSARTGSPRVLSDRFDGADGASAADAELADDETDQNDVAPR